ncbi:glycosyltransferase family 4 protein [Mucilaginibacter ginkgonis]|uniref:Glycosyltransferase family 4 protein n=1 Tax=Mucilaginibacter ginkgonis TaxID=2682091 RepID=A0A6I4HZB2_9SPHI|nr:glycosyltransferase family 4 protein [Mucilaginibacter ginkgonis]QQL50201.1 glycosyltransferase family 4 protein [Mucilaginibacter ginkgonis]
MASLKRRILFIVHDAARSGAPVLLLYFLRWLKVYDNEIKFDVLILRDGPLRKDFEALAKTFIVPKEYRYTLTNKLRVRKHPELVDKYRISEVTAKLSKNGYTLVYGNTIVSLPYLLEFKRRVSVKTVCAIHELSNAIAFYFGKEDVTKSLPQADLIIAGSQAVKHNLNKEFSIPDDKIKVFHAFVDFNMAKTKDADTLRGELDIAKDELIIGGMSQIELRKGVDLIVPVAVSLKKNYPGVKFKILWVGGTATDNFIQVVKQDAQKCGVSEQILFIEHTSYPDDYINLYDIFLLLSREDPFPLVLLSAAHMGKGLIAFRDSGGAEELLNDGAGFMASYLNTQEIATIIADLYYHPDKISNAGKIAQEKVTRDFNLGKTSGLIYKALVELYK